MADRPYSRLYHELADEYPDLYDSPDLAGYVRLLIAADQTWPTSARWAGYVTKSEVQRLADTGLVILDGARYRIKGMDKERDARSDHARLAANARHARSSALSSAGSNAQSMPSRDETSRAEPSMEGDAFDAYYQLTGRIPRGGAKDWLSRLIDTHGDKRVSQTLAAVWKKKADIGSLLGDSENLMTTWEREQEKAADERRRKAAADREREERERIANATPEEKARAAAVRDSIKTYVGGLR
jgi:hypothetical protein